MIPGVTLRMEDGFFGNFQLGDEEALIAPILNLSAGGMNIAIPSKTHIKIKNGDRLKLVRIAGTQNLNFASEVPAEIIAIEEQNRGKYLAANCIFLELVDEARDQIIRLVDNERKMRGQYG